MSATPPSVPSSADASATNRFTSQASTAEDLLKSQTVGLVRLSDFRKRRAEALEQKERQSSKYARFAPASAGARSGTATPSSNDEGVSASAEQPKKKRKALSKGKLSFGLDEEDGDEAPISTKPKSTKLSSPARQSMSPAPNTNQPSRLGPNTSLASPAPRVLTKSALRVESMTREALRKDFLAMQEAVRATEILVPFVFYDGTNIPGGACRIKKGEQIWLLLDRARKVGAKLGVNNSGSGSRGDGRNGAPAAPPSAAAGASEAAPGGDQLYSSLNSNTTLGSKANNKTRSHWARIGVDDLLLVRGEVIIPHHYEIYYFIVNRTLGPNSKPLFDYASTTTTTTDPPKPKTKSKTKSSHRKHHKPTPDPSEGDPTPPSPSSSSSSSSESDHEEPEPYNPLTHPGTSTSTPSSNNNSTEIPDTSLEGSNEEANYTKVVDRRWYERNKHIWPASMWEEFDPGKTYEGRVRKDAMGNTFFFS